MLSSNIDGRRAATIVFPNWRRSWCARMSTCCRRRAAASTFAAKGATSTIPIVFETGAEPVAAGLVASLNKPGGNITGVTSLNAQVGPKRLESLYELLPAASTFALLANPTNPRNAEATVGSMQAAARALKLKLELVHASSESEFDGVFAKARELRAAGLVIANETYYAMRSDMLEFWRSATDCPPRINPASSLLAGGLMSYGGDVMEIAPAGGRLYRTVPKGEKPADLPVAAGHQVRTWSSTLRPPRCSASTCR